MARMRRRALRVCELKIINDGSRDAFVRYRALYQDFEEGSGSDRFVWDVTLHGPILGLNVRF